MDFSEDRFKTHFEKWVEGKVLIHKWNKNRDPGHKEYFESMIEITDGSPTYFVYGVEQTNYNPEEDGFRGVEVQVRCKGCTTEADRSWTWIEKWDAEICRNAFMQGEYLLLDESRIDAAVATNSN